MLFVEANLGAAVAAVLTAGEPKKRDSVMRMMILMNHVSGPQVFFSKYHITPLSNNFLPI